MPIWHGVPRLVGHHLELDVAAHPEVGRPHSDDGAVGDVGEAFDNEPGAGHLAQPVVVAPVRPVLRAVLHKEGAIRVKCHIRYFSLCYVR